MSSTNVNCENIVTFKELKKCQTADLIQNLKPIELINICKNSDATAEDIYHFWIENVFKTCKTYISKIQLNDWQKIIDYFGALLRLATNEDEDANETPSKNFDKCCQCTSELVEWMQTNFVELDINIMLLLIHFVLNDIERCLEVNTSKSQANTVASTQEKLLPLLAKYIEKPNLMMGESLSSLMQVLSKLCDIGVQLSQTGVKIAMETWRVVGKLSVSGFTWSQSMNLKKTPEERFVWSNKPLVCLFNELYKLLIYIQKKHEVNSANENFFKLMHFYLKLIKIIINCCRVEDFPAAKQFFNCYLLVNSLLKDNTALQEQFKKIDMNDTLQEVFELIYYKDETVKFLTTQCCMPNTDCNVFMDYLAICLKHHQRDEYFLTKQSQLFSKIFDKLFENSYIYVTNKDYSICLTNFAILLLLDSSFALHKHLCVQVIEADWISAHASADILRIYYNFYYKHGNLEMMWSLIEFWCKCLEQYAYCSFNKRKFLIQYILENIIEEVPLEAIERLANTFTNCGQNTKQLCDISKEKSLSVAFCRTLNDNLHKLEKFSISQDDYYELLNALEIVYHKFNSISNINDILMKLTQAFIALLSKAAGNICDLQLFFNNCFLLFKKLKITQNKDVLILNCLNDNADQAEEIYSVFMLDCLLHYLPHSRNLLQKLKMPADFHKVKFLLQAPSSNIIKTADNQQMDLQIFRKLDSTNNSHSSFDLLTAKRIKLN